jgi:hypothetical protein
MAVVAAMAVDGGRLRPISSAEGIQRGSTEDLHW